jgi:hypothetical protein
VADEHDDARLRDVVGRAPRAGLETGDRRRRQQHAAARGQHRAERRAEREKDGREVHREDILPRRRRLLGARGADPGDARVRPHDVEPPVAGGDVGDERVDRGLVGDVDRGAEPPIPAATAAAPVAFRSATTTRAPARANRRAPAAPMPEAPPVTRQTRSVRSMPASVPQTRPSRTRLLLAGALDK